MDDLITKLYIEPTSYCNLSCPMCSRNNWIDEKLGHMDYKLYEKVLLEANEISSIYTAFFGGIGEPLVHPLIIEMIKAAKKLGKNVELITNGTLLDEEMSIKILNSGLNKIWISIDSLDFDEYAEIRRGAEYQAIKDNLLIFNRLRKQKRSKLNLGLSFVLMKRNADQLPKLPAFARENSISDIKISNLIPNNIDMKDETLYMRTLTSNLGTKDSGSMVNIDLPLFDLIDETKESLFKLLRGYADFSLMGTPLIRKDGYCRFVNEGNIFVRWDGEVCPCMALLHSGKTYLHDMERNVKYFSFGNLAKSKIYEIWQSNEYSTFRERVKKFDFSPCTICGACNLLEGNAEDCFNNPSPVCGGCLWAQGLIQCP